jgi:hypothetical protein
LQRIFKNVKKELITFVSNCKKQSPKKVSPPRKSPSPRKVSPRKSPSPRKVSPLKNIRHLAIKRLKLPWYVQNMIKDYVFLDKKTAVQNLTVHLNNILESNKKVDKDEVIQHLEEYKNIDPKVKNMVDLLKEKRAKVDKYTVMMIIDVCNDLVGK